MEVKMESAGVEFPATPQPCVIDSSPLHADDPISNLDATPSRQSRLLQSRNARFSAKRLSVSRIGSKIAQRTKHDPAGSEEVALNNKENTPLSSHVDSNRPSQRHSPAPNKNQPLKLDAQISGGFVSSKVRHSKAEGLVEQRNVLRKRHSSPLIYQSSNPNKRSPASSATSSDSVKSIRLREVSANELRSPHFEVLSRHRIRKQKSMQLKAQFDTEDYIQHIENELLQAKEALNSPTSQKTLQSQLKSARSENDRLKQEIADMRNTFEAEVKSTLEHKTAAEAELTRKVKLLEDELIGKACRIQDLEYEHEEKRLDSSTMDTLKATIERLEAEKFSMEEENRSMTKRNEVLSELLAMSPTKSRPPFELRSPVREKRPGRPMSLIIPRLPSSPTAVPVQSYTTLSRTSSPLVTTSKSLSLAAEIVPFSLEDDEQRSDTYPSFAPGRSQRVKQGRRANSNSTSDISTSGSVSSPVMEASHNSMLSSPVHSSSTKTAFRRKPRRFMHGSTQLKPLLLPTLRSDLSGQNSASVLGSPGSMVSIDRFPETWDSDSYFGLPPDLSSAVEQNVLSNSSSGSNKGISQLHESCYQHQTVDEILAQHRSKEGSYCESSGDEGQHPSSEDHGHVLTGPGPTLIGAQIAPVKHDYMSSGAHSNDLERGDQDPPNPATDQSFIVSTQGPSLSFDLESLKQLRLPVAVFDKLPPDPCHGDIRLASDVPAPLFSPLLRRSTRPSSIPVRERDTGHMSEGVSHKKRRQSRSTIFDAAVSSSPIMLRGPSFEPHGSPAEASMSRLLAADRRENKFLRTKSPNASAAVSLSRSITPLEMLHRRQFGARPLAAFTVRTICTALSRCTAFVRDIKSDPLALARKVLANAWFANWKRFGRMSWWVLGIFLPQKVSKTLPRWDWDDFDGEMIAQRCCEEAASKNESHDAAGTNSCRALTTIHHENDIAPSGGASLGTIDDDSKPGWCKSVFLWGKFSIAIMLAVGGAVVKGPAEMLRDLDSKTEALTHRPAFKHESADGGRPNVLAPHVHNQDLRNYSSHRRPSTRNMIRRTNHDNDRILHPTSGSHLSFSFRSPKQLSEFPSSGEFGPPDDNTLRPVKTRKRFVGDVFELPRQATDSGSATNEGTWSHDSSISGGFLKWPPDLEPDYPEYHTSTTYDDS